MGVYDEEIYKALKLDKITDLINDIHNYPTANIKSYTFEKNGNSLAVLKNKNGITIDYYPEEKKVSVSFFHEYNGELKRIATINTFEKRTSGAYYLPKDLLYNCEFVDINNKQLSFSPNDEDFINLINLINTDGISFEDLNEVEKNLYYSLRKQVRERIEHNSFKVMDSLEKKSFKI